MGLYTSKISGTVSGRSIIMKLGEILVFYKKHLKPTAFLNSIFRQEGTFLVFSS